MEDFSQTLLNSAPLAGAIVVLCVAVAGFLWLLIRLSALKLAPVAALLVGFCLEAIFIKQPYIQAGLQLYPTDLISLFVMAAFLFGFIKRPLPITEAPFLLWLVFGGLMFLSLFIGLAEYGKSAGTEARPIFYLWAAGVYCFAAGFDEQELRRIARWCVWTAYACLGIAVYIWLGTQVGLLDQQTVAEFADVGGVFRPVTSHVAFYVATVGLVQTLAWLRGTGTRLSGLHAAAFLGFVVIMQHRSVWVAASIGLLCVMYLERKHLPRRFPLILGFALAVTLATSIAGALGYLDELAASLVQSTLSMSFYEGTLRARIDGWERLMGEWWQSSLEIVLFGFPFGRGFARLANTEIVEFSPHNFYVDLVLRVGIVGTLSFFVCTCIAIVRAFRMPCSSEFEYLLSRGLAAGLVASLVYCMAYSSYYLVTAATGALLAYMLRQRQQRDRSLAAERRAVGRAMTLHATK